METLFLVMLCYFLSGNNLSQSVCDDFSNQDLLHQTQWTGDTMDFMVNNEFQLQLNADSGGGSFLFAELPFSFEMQWELDIRLDFAPSAGNRLIIFLKAAMPDLETGDAWFLEIGETGNADPVRLFRRENGHDILMGESEPAVVAIQPVEMKLKVTYTGLHWNMYAGMQGGLMELLFSVREEHPGIEGHGFFGLHCTYSASRRDKFYFDNICIGPYVPDIVPPAIVSLSVRDPQSLEATFSEAISQSEIGVEDFSIRPGDIRPVQLEVSRNKAILLLKETLIDGNAYVMHIRAVSDLSGNTARDLTIPFQYHRIEMAERYEWLVHEIMADPTPAISLPAAEYIELYQNGLFTFNLGDYRIRIGNRILPLPEKVILPGTCVILCSPEDTTGFRQFGIVAGVDGLPALPNTGTTIEIVDPQDSLIHRVQYEKGWYRDPDKDDGGWSLEMINTANICAGGENWLASNDLSGGTPGRPNSVEETWPDLNGPVLLDVFPLDSTRIVLSFDEDLTHHQIDPMLFTCVPDVDILDIHTSGPHDIAVTLTPPLQPSVMYSMSVDGIQDCIGNSSSKQSIQFGLPQPIWKGDLVINEILFNPGTGGARFVEILNRSGKVFSSEDLVLGQINRSGEDLVQATGRKLILPGEMIAFAGDRRDIMHRYDVPNPKRLLEADLPRWGNDEGNVSILSRGIVIDSFSYRAEWHHPLLEDVNGVSLERVSKDAPSHRQDTWHSAASTVGFATPTGENSQSVPILQPPVPFQFASTTFSPDQDGYEDALLINFSPDMQDATASIFIHDHAGRFVRSIARNATIAANEVFVWDGTNENGEIQRVGTYLVRIEIFTPEGSVQRFTDVCVLAGKF